MIANDLPYCCGMNLLSGFGNTDTAMDKSEYTVEEVDKFLKTYTSKMRGNIAVLNSDQYSKLHTVFEDNGYEEVRKFHYSGHGNNIHVFMNVHPNNEIKTPQHEIQ